MSDHSSRRRGRVGRFLTSLRGCLLRGIWWATVFAAVLVLLGHLISELSDTQSWMNWPWQIPWVRYPAVLVDIIFLSMHLSGIITRIRSVFDDLVEAD